jgi:hypothetical protein
MTNTHLGLTTNHIPVAVVCPTCHHCPTCGRSTATWFPPAPPYYPSPMWTTRSATTSLGLTATQPGPTSTA